MENERYENASESGFAVSEIDSAMRADVDLLRLGFRITGEEQRKTAYQSYCRFLSEYRAETEDKGEKTK